MTESLSSLVRQSIVAPHEAVQVLMSWRLSREAGWMMLALAICLSVVFVFALTGARPMPLVPGSVGIGPLTLATMVFGLSVMLVFAIYFSGDALGGEARFADTVVIVAWLQAMQFLAQIVQAFAILISPVLAAVLSFGIIGWLFWLLLTMIKGVMGFDTMGRAAMTLLLAITGVVLVTSLIFGLLGFNTPGGV